MQLAKWLSRVIPAPILFLFRGLLSPVVGYRVASSWDDACRKSSGYRSSRTIAKSLRLNKLQKSDECFLEPRELQVASAFLEAVSCRKSTDRIRVIDFGGGSGNYLYAIQRIAPSLDLDWIVLETPEFCNQITQEHRSIPNLSWVDSIDDLSGKFDIALLSGVLQYLQSPFELLTSAIQLAEFVILNRLPLSDAQIGRVCIQRPGLFESHGSYPVRILSEQEVLGFLDSKGAIISRWLVPEDIAVVRFRPILGQGLSFRPGLDAID
jgi:putative methyltransferase (TIGR04325 family)